MRRSANPSRSARRAAQGCARIRRTGVAALLAWSLLPHAAVAEDAWAWPLQPRPRVVRAYAPPAYPWGPGHRGVDLAGAPGQSVLAVAPGTVTFAGQVAGVGVVVVRHGWLRSTYQPVAATVRAGAQVTTGTVVGALVTVGSHCLPEACLHLGARRGERYLDPLDLLSDLPIRLKPLDGTSVQPLAPPLSRRGSQPRVNQPEPTATSGARMGLTVGRP